MLKCFASSALRVASAAVAAGLDLSRSVVFAGGEPLTAARRDFLARSGLRVYARYAATETGFIAGACPHGEDGGEMHLYADRLALIGPEPDGLTPARRSPSPSFRSPRRRCCSTSSSAITGGSGSALAAARSAAPGSSGTSATCTARRRSPRRG